jgi:hypothetical protein
MFKAGNKLPLYNFTAFLSFAAPIKVQDLDLMQRNAFSSRNNCSKYWCTLTPLPRADFASNGPAGSNYTVLSSLVSEADPEIAQFVNSTDAQVCACVCACSKHFIWLQCFSFFDVPV